MIKPSKEVFDLKIPIIENNVYKTFATYSSLEINFVIKTFQKESSTIKLLQRQFGEKYDGVNAKKNLQYYEKTRLDAILIRVENRLKYVRFMLENKHKFSNIEEIFRDKKDFEIDKIATSLVTPSKNKKKKVIYKNTLEMQKDLAATTKQLIDAIEFLPSHNHRFICKRTYALGVQRLSELQIRSMLNISEEEYKTYLKEICKKLPELVQQVKKLESEREPVVKRRPEKRFDNSQNSKKIKKEKSLLTSKVKEKISQKTITSDLQVSENKEEKVVLNKKGRKKQKSFLNYFFEKEENLNISEVKRVKLAIEYQAHYSKKGYEAFCILYDKDTLLLKDNAKLEPNQKSNFRQFIVKVKKLLKENNLLELERKVEETKIKKEKEDEKNPNKRRYNLKNIFESFFTEEMTYEEKNIAIKKARLAIIVQSRITKRTYEDFCAVYNPVTGDLIEEASKNKKIRNSSNQFIKNIKIIMDTYSLEELKERVKNRASNYKSKKGRKRKESFLNYFYTEEMTEKEKDLIQQKVRLAIEYQKNRREKDFIIFCKIYDKDSYKLNPENKLEKNEKNNFFKFKNVIRFLIENNSLEEIEKLIEAQNQQKEIKKKNKDLLPSFLDYFYDDKLPLKERKIIEEKFTVAFSLIKLVAKSCYDDFKLIYDEKTWEIKEKANPSKEQLKNIKIFKTRILKAMCSKNLEELQEEYERKIKEIQRKNVRNEEYKQSINESLKNANIPRKNIAYIDALIAKCYENFEDSELILSTLKISQSDLIDFYIKNLTNINHPEKVIDYILKNAPHRTSEILISGFFGDFRNTLTKTEQQLIYFRLLQRVDDSITEEKIATILNLDLDIIRNYEVMTIDDGVNQLNRYIKKREIK